MPSQVPWRLCCFHDKMQVKQDLKQVPFFGGKFSVNRQANQMKHSIPTPKGITTQEGSSSSLSFGSTPSHLSITERTPPLP